MSSSKLHYAVGIEAPRTVSGNSRRGFLVYSPVGELVAFEDVSGLTGTNATMASRGWHKVLILTAFLQVTPGEWKNALAVSRAARG